jgi:hypothetical protein
MVCCYMPNPLALDHTSHLHSCAMSPIIIIIIITDSVHVTTHYNQHLRRVRWCCAPCQVPKMLHALRHDWAPACMLVSFKLETDESILLKKVSACTAGWLACTCSCCVCVLANHS